ncbi:hypothetical protein D3C74_435960 [compost metagenome]
MARAIAQSCCTAIEWEDRADEGSMSRLRRARYSRALRRVAGQLMKGPNRISCPSMMFSATERFEQRLTSWYTVLMPASWESRVRVNRCSAPETTMRPASIW